MHYTTSSSFFFILFSLFSTSFGDEPCGKVEYGCGSHGRCHLDTRSCGDSCTERCVCNEGFDGNDCTVRLDICPGAISPDGARSCLHGGRCMQNADEQWICDCSSAKKGGKMYAGHQCEFAAQVSCEIGKQNSAHAFCTNGGRCYSQVKSGEHHPLCDCDDAFEGRHCQYAKGSRPEQEKIYAIPPPPANEGISGGVIAGAVAVSLIICVGAALFWMRFKGTAKTFSNIKIPNDLDMKPEPKIKEGMEEASTEII